MSNRSNRCNERTARRPVRLAALAAVLLVGGGAGPVRADEIDLTGDWQMSTSCGPGLSAVRSVAITEDVGTGAVTIATANCGTLFFESAIHVLASCTSSWSAVVSGSTFLAPPSGFVTDDVQFETPFPSSFLGCAAPPCARYTAETVMSGPITVDAGTATQITAPVTFGHVEVFNTDDVRTFNNGGPGGCTTTFLRNSVPAGAAVTVVPFQDTSLTFDSVVTPGVVQLTPLTEPAAVVPANFQLFDLPIYYDVETTAVFAGTAALCLPYPDSDNNGFIDITTPAIPEGSILLLHEEGGVFVDRTVSRDTVLNRVCAAVSSFSQFVPGAATSPSVCGDGSVQLGEQCDDGNTISGDCCSALCQNEAAGSPCPSDGNACTDDVCDANGTCGVPHVDDCDDDDPCTQDACNPLVGCENIAAPTAGCRPAGLSLLMLKRDANDSTKDKLLWKWVHGQSASLAELQDPTDNASYALCVYGGGNTLLADVLVPPGTTNWSPLGTKGFKYSDANASTGGVKKVVLKSGLASNAKALVKGGGTNLPDPPAGPLALPLTAQLRNLATGLCMEGTYDTADVLKNDAGQFKAKH